MEDLSNNPIIFVLFLIGCVFITFVLILAGMAICLMISQHKLIKQIKEHPEQLTT